MACESRIFLCTLCIICSVMGYSCLTSGLFLVFLFYCLLNVPSIGCIDSLSVICYQSKRERQTINNINIQMSWMFIIILMVYLIKTMHNYVKQWLKIWAELCFFVWLFGWTVRTAAVSYEITQLCIHVVRFLDSFSLVVLVENLCLDIQKAVCNC